MSRFEGKTYQKIASELNLSVKTVETQVGKALDSAGKSRRVRISHQLSYMDERYNDIDTLIAKFLAGEASLNEASRLDDWINASSEKPGDIQSGTSCGYEYTCSGCSETSANSACQPNQNRFYTPSRFAGLSLLAASLVTYWAIREVDHNETLTSHEKLYQSITFFVRLKIGCYAEQSVQSPPRTKFYPAGFSAVKHTLILHAIHKVLFTIIADDLEIRVLGTAF